MKKDLTDRLTSALESGKYKQADGHLKVLNRTTTVDKDGPITTTNVVEDVSHCCIGVLAEVAHDMGYDIAEFETVEGDADGVACRLPLSGTASLGSKDREAVELHGTMQDILVALNDGDASFKTIAAVLPMLNDHFNHHAILEVENEKLRNAAAKDNGELAFLRKRVEELTPKKVTASKAEAKRQFLKDWIAALESGEYEQANGHLRHIDDEDKASYCCLGVLCEIGPHEWNSGNFGLGHAWKREGAQSLSREALDELGISEDFQSSLIYMNDSLGKNFSEIAQFVRRVILPAVK